MTHALVSVAAYLLDGDRNKHPSRIGDACGTELECFSMLRAYSIEALVTTRNSLLDMYLEAQDLPNSHSVASRLLLHLSGSWQTTKCHAHGCTKR